MKRIKKILSIALAITVAFFINLGTADFAGAASQKEINTAFNQCGDYLYKNVSKPEFGVIGGEWVMYGLGRAGYKMSDEYVEGYRKSVEDVLKKKKGILHSKKYTEYSRVIVAYAALGLDATDIAGYNLVERYGDYYEKDGKVNFWLSFQGLNGPIWALRALDSRNYQIPKAKDEKYQLTREKLLREILNQQLKDGGWSFAGEVSDPDMTAMAIESLAPYRQIKKTHDEKLSKEVEKAIEKGIETLSKLQNDQGGYLSWGASNSESCAQIICALTSVGMNPNTDLKFRKKGKSVMDGLLSFYDSEIHGFRHVNEKSNGYEAEVNQMATEQAYYALASYKMNVPDKEKIKTIGSQTKKGAKKGSIKLQWSKSKVANGYQIKIARDSSFKTNVKSMRVSNPLKTYKTIKGLRKGKPYYVKVRAYKVVNGKKLYGSYSKYKKVRIK